MSKLCKVLLLSGWIVTATGSIAIAQGKKAQSVCGITVRGKAAAWQKITTTTHLKLKPASGTAKLPAAYTIYTIEEKQLKEFLKAAKSAPDGTLQIAIPLPGGLGCTAFVLANAQTMAAELAARYPELVSLKGQAVTNPNGGLLRLDYNGTDLRAEVTWNGTVYLLSTWNSGKQKYYLVYKKEDAGIEKNPYFKG